MNGNPTVREFRNARVRLRQLIEFVRKEEDDKAFAEYCEGIIEAARAALNVIAGE